MATLSIKDLKTFEIEFSHFINSYIKNVGGKGPKTTEVRYTKDTIIYFLYGILTEREKKLMQTPDGERVVIEARRLFLKLDKENRIKQCEEFLGHKVVENYESWNLETDSAIGVFRLEENVFP